MVGSRAVQLVVCLQLLIISSAIERCVEECLEISKVVQMLFDHNYSNFNANINGVYFDGLAIMSGNPRRHIWTYTAGFRSNQIGIDNCPCNNGNTPSVFPSFVGNDYYCESSLDVDVCNSTIFTNDPLWDGQQCPGVEAPCCNLPNMPWFTKSLNETTTDDIELRACQSNDGCKGSVPVFLIELYVR